MIEVSIEIFNIPRVRLIIEVWMMMFVVAGGVLRSVTHGGR
jgi:hypothetical protein